MSDKNALKVTSAGMRLIALLTFFNGDDDARLRTFIAESYHPELLAETDADARLKQLRDLRTGAGKLKVQQVIGVSKEHVIVLLTSQSGAGQLVDLKVGADYPHTIISIQLSEVVVDIGTDE